jgi:hypothetical protein
MKQHHVIKEAPPGKSSIPVECGTVLAYIVSTMARTGATEQFLQTLETFSGGKLKRRADFGLLLDAAHSSDQHGVLEQLCFHAKFSVKAYGIMKRIGKDGEGYDRLAAEFTESMNIITGHLRTLIRSAEPDERQPFESRYLVLNAESFRNLMELLNDLAWYKNWLIDQKR